MFCTYYRRLLASVLGCALMVGSMAILGTSYQVQAARTLVSGDPNATLVIKSAVVQRNKTTHYPIATIVVVATYPDDLYTSRHSDGTISAHCTIKGDNGITFEGQQAVTALDKGDHEVTISASATKDIHGPFDIMCDLHNNSESNLATAQTKNVHVSSELCEMYSPSLQGSIPFADVDCMPPSAGMGTYNIYILAIEPGGSVFIGQQSDVEKPSCNFADGGLCHANDPNVQVLNTLGGPYSTFEKAKAAYCQMLTETHAAFGGIKGTVGGHLYWLDNAPTC